MVNPLTGEEAEHGRARGRESMVKSGALAQRGVVGRRRMRERREATEIALDLFADMLEGA
jgi:hypothetical protein